VLSKFHLLTRGARLNFHVHSLHCDSTLISAKQIFSVLTVRLEAYRLIKRSHSHIDGMKTDKLVRAERCVSVPGCSDGVSLLNKNLTERGSMETAQCLLEQLWNRVTRNIINYTEKGALLRSQTINKTKYESLTPRCSARLV
jgi:hypothetical protein